MSRKCSQPSPLRVAAYCRVSTSTEYQESSLGAQIQYYISKINSRLDWVCVVIFADTGSGMNTKGRAEFLKLMQLCQREEVDLILTKSISRFGRNTIDALKAVRKLQALGVDACFEAEGIPSLDRNTQFIMETLAALAQEESESKSKDIKWGLHHSYKDVDSKSSHFIWYGYTHDEKGHLVINELEAEVVRLIFQLRPEGYSLRKISAKLKQQKVFSPTGKSKWSATSNLFKYNLIKTCEVEWISCLTFFTGH